MSEKNKSVIEEALLQMKLIENSISENAKGILASTMKQEISDLVKESLSGKKRLHEDEEASVEGGEEFDDPTEVDTEVEFEDESQGLEQDVNDPEAMPPVEDGGVDGDNELPPLDMTQADMPELMRVFKAMGDEDGIIVKKQDDGDIHLVDNSNNTEYLITMGEDNSQEPMNMMESYMDEEFYEMENEFYEMDDTVGMDEEFYEMDDTVGMDEEFYEMDDTVGMDEEFYEMDDEPKLTIPMGEMEYREGVINIGGTNDETVYEIDQDVLEDVLESFKYSKKPNMDGGFDDDMEEAPKRHGKGKKLKSIYPSNLKHGVHETYNEYDEEEEYEGWVDEDDVEEGEIEATEASRVIANKRKAKRGLMAAPKQLKEEVLMLREKNEEYKKALDFFRTKLDEVAVFNSNLAYSTRLFTEHSTTKQEKINILRRFDNVENIKESKNLYKTIKEELGGNNTKGSIKESVQNRVVRTPQTGSSSNLIESKTYENPQFLRMKDLMTKIK